MDIPEAQSLLDDIDIKGRGLSAWEVEFMNSMLTQVDAGRPPSDKQAETIRRVHRDRVG